MSAGWDTTAQIGLGVCASPEHLVPGDVDSMHTYADRLRRIADGAARVSWLLARVDAGALHGDYGAALRARLATQPAPYDLTASALPVAAGAVTELAETITQARLVARQAVAMVNDAELDSHAWQNARDQADRPGLGGPVPPPAAVDPGQARRDQAGQLLAAAHADVELAGQRARSVLGQVTRAAPQIDRGYRRGATDTCVGLLQFARQSVLHPRQTAAATGRQLRHTLADPAQAARQEATAFTRTPKEYLGGLAAGAPLGPVGRGLRGVDVPPDPPAPGPGPTTDHTWPFKGEPPQLKPALWQHLFQGELNRYNKGTGYHHRPDGIDAPGRQLDGPITPGPMGTYRVDGIIFTRPNGTTTRKARSSFFPDDWSQGMVRNAVEDAWRSPSLVVQTNAAWIGTTSDGLQIQGFVGADGLPVTAYPVV